MNLQVVHAMILAGLGPACGGEVTTHYRKPYTLNPKPLQNPKP